MPTKQRHGIAIVIGERFRASGDGSIR